MKIENQVCTPEQAKRLVELGVGNENSAFLWIKMKIIDSAELGWHTTLRTPLGLSGFGALIAEGPLPAFSSAELGVMLPGTIMAESAGIITRKNGDGSFTCSQLHIGHFCESTEARAKAVMLIHLIEKNIIKAINVNARLGKVGP